MKRYCYSVNRIRDISGNVVKCNVLKYRAGNEFGVNPIMTSLSKWEEKTINLTENQMARFRELQSENDRREYLSRIYALS